MLERAKTAAERRLTNDLAAERRAAAALKQQMKAMQVSSWVQAFCMLSAADVSSAAGRLLVEHCSLDLELEAAMCAAGCKVRHGTLFAAACTRLLPTPCCTAGGDG